MWAGLTTSRGYLLCGQGQARVNAEMLLAPQYAHLHRSFSAQVSPRQSDLLLVAGSVNRRLGSAILRLSRQLAEPAQCLVVGSEAGLPQLNSPIYPGNIPINKMLPATAQVAPKANSSEEIAAALNSLPPLLTEADFNFAGATEGPGTLVPLRRAEEHELATEDLTLSIGPEHPAIYGPLRLILILDGEQVAAVQADPGYAHRGLEKAVEGVRPSQVVAFGEALDGLAPLTGATVVAQALESLLSFEPLPMRAAYLRLVALEIERIASHLFATARLLRTLALAGQANQLLGIRHKIVEALEAFTGNPTRFSKPAGGYIVPGGVDNDATKEASLLLQEAISPLPNWVRQKLDPPLRRQWLSRYSFESRLRNIGTLTAENATAWGVSGPNLRASGVNFDGRTLNFNPNFNNPNLAYQALEFRPATIYQGDCLARYRLRLIEIAVSATLVKAALDNLPSGLHRISSFEVDQARFNFDPAQSPAEVSSWVESPRGLLGAHLSLSSNSNKGSIVVERLHFSSPSWRHYSLLPDLLVNERLADALVIINTLDIAPDEAER